MVAEALGPDDRQVAAMAANSFAGAFHPGRAAAVVLEKPPAASTPRPPRAGPVTVTAAFTPPTWRSSPTPTRRTNGSAAGRVLYDPASDHRPVPHHADVNAVLRDRRFGRTYPHVASHAEMGRPEEPTYLGAFWYLIRNGMLDREPPDHTRLRRLVAKAFTPWMVEAPRRVQARRHPGRRSPTPGGATSWLTWPSCCRWR